MKKTFIFLVTLALVLSFSLVTATPVVADPDPGTIDVSQPVQVSSDTHYERGQSIIYDGSNYWLFYGRSDSVTDTYESGNPDTHDYRIYYKKASTVSGLAAATPTLLSSGSNHNIYLGETDAAYYQGIVRVYAAVDVGATCDLYQFHTTDGGSTWMGVVMRHGLPDGAAHFAVTTCGDKLWFAYQMGGNWTSRYCCGWSPSEYDITNNYGTAKFYVEGTNLYFVRADSGDQDIFKWNSGNSTWSQIDSDTESGPWDPTIYKIGSNYVCAYAPWVSPKQWIKAKVGTSLSTLLSSPTVTVNITAGGYSTTNTWVDMWPTGFTDNSGDTYLFYTSERNPSDPLSEIAGNIWYLKVDWSTSNDHYTYIQNAIDAASAGDTVNVMAGTYVEDLVIPAGMDGLDLKGSGSNVTTIKGVATADDSLGDPPVYNIRFDEFDGVSGVKIHGFTIESPDVPTNHFASGMVLNGQDIEIYDNCFVSKGAEAAEDNYCVAIQTWRWSAAPDSDITGLKIYNNTFSSEGDLWVYQGVFVNRDGEDFGDVTVSGNNFSGNIHMGIAYEGNNAVISDNEMTSTYEGVGIAIMDWAELEQNDVEVDGNELQGFNDGVIVGRGDQVMTNITVANNAFSDNRYQVRDRADALNLDDVLAHNDFDRAVVVRGSGIKVPTIFSSIQDAIDAAVAGDTVEVAVATYDESVTIDKNNLTLTGEVGSKPAITGGLKLDDVSGFTLQNFEVTGTVDTGNKNSLVRMYGVITDLIVDNCVFDGENTADRNGFSGGQIEGDLSVTNSEFKDIVGWAVLDTRSGSGGDGSAMDTVTFANNNVHDCDGSIAFRGLSTNWTDNVYIYDNTFQDIGEEAVSDHWAAFEVNRVTNVEVYDNEIRNVVECSWGEGQAMQLWQVGTVSIHDNTIENNYMGIAFLKWPADETYDVSNISIHYNKFSGNDQYALSVEDGLTGGLVDATYNWWGSSSGPYHKTLNPGGTGDAVSDYVDFEPWLREVPTVTTQAATEVRFILATVNMDYTVGGYSPVQVRFAYKKSTDTEWSYTAWVSKSVDGAHAQLLRVIDFGARYDFKAQLKYDDVVDGETVIEGSILQFTTSPIEGCFIATAAYGTPSAEQIDVLREFRDMVLLESTVGSQLVALYYQLSPPVAEFIAGNELLRTMVRELLVDPIVGVVEATGNVWRN